ncbi:hypothetical protein Cgig2_032204 [Carnegiea gigantea]|uniref:Uncharacterized protein n=1 Tax=Carnegiea gigantea TaxID=171969 RepID=A0A9Q1K4R2_9CARY|nr:hypothetical protein Cgig2_032204 [Carnegiea gigantea]
MDVHVTVIGDGGGGREIVICVLLEGGVLAQNGKGKVTYEGGSKRCMVVKEGMGVEEVIRIVKEVTGIDMSEKKLWYVLKYDREMLLAVEGDTDMKMIFKGNDEHDYLYVSRNKGPLRQGEESVAVCEGRVRACHDGQACSRSGRNGHDGVEVGQEGGRNQAGGKRKGINKDLSAEQRAGEDIIELSDDDEMFIASEDAGDEETIE